MTYHQFKELDADGLVGQPARPKSSFWTGDRTKAREVSLKVWLPNSEVVEAKDGYTYVAMGPPGDNDLPRVTMRCSTKSAGEKQITCACPSP